MRIKHKSASEWLKDDEGKTRIFENCDAAYAYCKALGAVEGFDDVLPDWNFDPIIPEIGRISPESCIEIMEAVVKRAWKDYAAAKPGSFERTSIIRFFRGPSLFTATYDIDGEYMVKQLKERYPD